MPGAKHTPKNDAMIAEYKAGASIKVIAQNHGVSSKRVLAVMKALAPEVSTSERRMGLPDTSIAGQRFGRLIALAPSRSIRGRWAWKCACDCGGEKEVSRLYLVTGGAVSCGCVSPGLRHGMWGTPEWRAWASMKGRCSNPRLRSYPDYGGRGIRVCEEWAQSFDAFLKDMGRRPSAKHSLDRIDVNGNYESGNCRWADRKEQQRNRRVNVRIEFNGKTQTLIEWSEETGIVPETISGRLRAGWPASDALTTPVGTRTRWSGHA